MKKVMVVVLGLALSTAVFAAGEGKQDGKKAVNCKELADAKNAAGKKPGQNPEAGNGNSGPVKEAR